MSKLRKKTVHKVEKLHDGYSGSIDNVIKFYQDIKERLSGCSNVRVDVSSWGYDPEDVSIMYSRLETDKELETRQKNEDRKEAAKLKKDKADKDINVKKLSDMKKKHADQQAKLEARINNT